MATMSTQIATVVEGKFREVRLVRKLTPVEREPEAILPDPDDFWAWAEEWGMKPIGYDSGDIEMIVDVPMEDIANTWSAV